MSSIKTTESVRINAEIIRQVRKIVKHTGQSINGYISISLQSRVLKDLAKYKIKPDEESNIRDNATNPC